MNDASDSSSLQSHYEFWDDFVRKWWYATNTRTPYLPEPWWGWVPEEGALHSVTVNLSPGSGGKLQTRRCIGCAAGCFNVSYSVLMHDDTLRCHLSETEEWHLKRRYRPLLRALAYKDDGNDDQDDKIINAIATDTRHHLSIELRPFHDGVSNALYQKQHKDDIINHALLFAAQASTLIESPKSFKSTPTLKNIVIVRSAFKNIEDIVGNDNKVNIAKDIDNSKAKVFLATELFKDRHPELSKVKFVCISGARNHLPGTKTLNNIIEEASHIINNNSKPQ